MKKSLWIICLAFVAFIEPAFAARRSNITLEADLLYWDIGRSSFNYTHQKDPTTRNFCPGFDYGYRVGAFYQCKCWDLGLRFTSFDSEQRKTTGTETNTVNGKKVTTEFRAKYHLNFETLDFELGYSWQLAFNCIAFRPFVGCKTAWIDESFKQTLIHTHQYLKYRGFGLYLGTEGSVTICHYFEQPLQFVTRMAYGVMDAKFKKSGCCFYQPYLNVFVGLKQSLGGICNTSAILMAGYEAENFGAWDNFNHKNKDAFGLGGLVVRYGFSF